MSIVAIDIGGTEIKYALVKKDGTLLSTSKIRTEASKGKEELLKKIYKIVEKYASDSKIIGIAISTTGQVDGNLGEVVGGTELIPGWIGTKVVKILEEKYKIPVIIENDVNCAAVGEMWLGAGRNDENFICLTIGTGIGGGIVINRELFLGAGSVAAEFGHIQIEKNGKKCLCGKEGCYQMYASTSALLNSVYEKTKNRTNGKEFFQKVKNNEEIEMKIFNEWIDYLGDGLSSLIYIFNPKKIIIGGGISKQGDFLKNKIDGNLKKKVMKNYLNILDITMAELGNDAGLLGATYILLKKMKKNC